MDKRRVYFFDDDADFLTTLNYAVEHPSCEIHTCLVENGYRTIDDIIRLKPNILFIDFHLPQANGGQIIPILKAIAGFANVPIYIISGYPKESIEPFLKGVKCEGIIPKDEFFTRSILNILNQVVPPPEVSSN